MRAGLKAKLLISTVWVRGASAPDWAFDGGKELAAIDVSRTATTTFLLIMLLLAVRASRYFSVVTMWPA